MKKVFVWFGQRISSSKKPKASKTSWKPHDAHSVSHESETFHRPINPLYDWYRHREQLFVEDNSYAARISRLIRKIISGSIGLGSPLRRKVHSTMDKIEDIVVGPMPASHFLQPLRMTFKQNGIERYWDFMKLHESVSCIIFNTSRNVLIFVKQFRPAVYFGSIPQAIKSPKLNTDPTANQVILDVDWSKFPPSNGITLEMCAGIVDNPKLTIAEIAKQEVLEECGYDVPLSNFQLVSCFVSGVGVSGETQTMYYTEVTDDMKTGKGGGNVHEGEFIEVVELTIPEAKRYISQASVKSPSSFMFGMSWFLLNKMPPA